MNARNFIPKPVSAGSKSTLAFIGGAIAIAWLAWWGLTKQSEASSIKVESLASASTSARSAPVIAGPVEPGEGAPKRVVSSSPAPASRDRDPNVVGGASDDESDATISASLARKLKERARYAERRLVKEKEKSARLEGELSSLRARIEELTRARRPPPPTEAEEVLETLRPLLSAKTER